ncbi:MAG TPA: substrate-binding protein [Magnetospirillaceae bacterium]|jgi:ABC-type branched-subunit amino acid transport system substrate-binding protein
MSNSPSKFEGLSRRGALKAGAAVVGSAVLSPYLTMPVYADDKPAIGTWPEGSSGKSVFVGITVPRTGSYAAQGEDELKGIQLAIEHINSGHDLIKKISPKTTKGVLGKEVTFGVADSAAKPNTAVEEQTKFITDNKAILMIGATSSAVAVALNHFAQAQHVLYVTGISGSNDTTGKDCARYSFRQCFYGQTAAAGIGPVLLKAYGKNLKAAYLTPDYTYGHTVQKSMEDFLKTGGWTTVTNQVAPLGAPDYSNYLTNIANSGADVLINVNWGHDAVLSTQQAQQFGILPKMKLVLPYQIPFISKEVGPQIMEGVFAATDFWWTLEDKFPLAKTFVAEFQKKYGYRPEWTANNGYMQLAIWANMCEAAGSFYPPDVIKAYEAGKPFDSTVGECHFRAADHQLIRPVVIVKGKKPGDMKNPEDFWEVLDVLPGEPLMQAPDAFGCQLGGYT